MKRFFRHGAFAACAVAALMPALPANAQEVGDAGTAERARLLRTLPEDAARRAFGSQPAPAPLAARAIGFYSRGCLAGGTALEVDGPSWQVMRLSRNRNWGHPEMISFLETFAKEAPKAAGWPGILIGDVSQPRGGPMLTGHASHQIGLDADIWLTPMPERRFSSREREETSAVNMIRADWLSVDTSVWGEGQAKLIRLAAQSPKVERLLVNPVLKRALCDWAGTQAGSRAWLRKVRMVWGHNYHFHIRLHCPAGQSCQGHEPLPPGEGCGPEVEGFITAQREAILNPPPPKPAKPKPEITVAQLPDACRDVLRAR